MKDEIKRLRQVNSTLLQKLNKKTKELNDLKKNHDMKITKKCNDLVKIWTKI
jgi:hypothetical protein